MEVLAVGWHEPGHDYRNGPVPEPFLGALANLLTLTPKSDSLFCLPEPRTPIAGSLRIAWKSVGSNFVKIRQHLSTSAGFSESCLL